MKRVEPVRQALQRHKYVARVQDLHLDHREFCSLSFGSVVAMVSSIISSGQQPDPSQTGLFDAPAKPRQRNYELLSDNYTFVPCAL
jgi:UDP-glucose:glycoprotein glucosyltransferase